MSVHEYRAAQKLATDDVPFYALIMAAMRRADSENLARLRAVFPETYAEVEARYNAPGGILETD